MKADRLILFATVGIVMAVAAFAGVVSYSHFYVLGRDHGQDGTAARLTPLSVDLLILAASLVILWAARKDVAAPWPLRGVLVAGVAATIAGNVLYGLSHGPVGAVLSSWPGAAFVAAVEMLMWLVRESRRQVIPAAVRAFVAVASDAESAAAAALEATKAAGNPFTQNQLQQRFSLTRAQVRAVVASVNGSVPDAT